MPIEVGVQGAYSKGGIPVNVHGIANVKIAGEQPVLDNAIERFLGVARERIMADRQGHARGQPARRARDADARGAEPGQDQVRAVAARRGRGRSAQARARARHVEDPGRLRRRELPRQHRAPAVGRGAEERAHRRGARQGRERHAGRRQPPADRDLEDRGRHHDGARAQREPHRRRADARRRRSSPRRRGRSPRSRRAPRASSRSRRRASSRCGVSSPPTCSSRRARARPPPRPPPRATPRRSSSRAARRPRP